MDSRLVKAGVAMALGMVLLIPTFNAINNSYVVVDEVPPWLPSQLPENFQPPSNMPTPPPDWQPPPDWEPPEGWEDWEPPPDWEGKFEGDPPPGWEGGQCPPPVIVRPAEANQNLTLSGSQAWARQLQFGVPQRTVGVAVWVNATSWVASELRARIDSPQRGWGEEQSQAGNPPGAIPINGPTPVESTTFHWRWDYFAQGEQTAAPGTYTIHIEADPFGGLTQNNMRGSIKVETYLVLPCGGAFQ